MPKFGYRLKIARDAQSITQRDLQHVGIPQVSLSAIERGRFAPTDTRKRHALAQSLNISIPWLEDNKGTPFTGIKSVVKLNHKKNKRTESAALGLLSRETILASLFLEKTKCLALKPSQAENGCILFYLCEPYNLDDVLHSLKVTRHLGRSLSDFDPSDLSLHDALWKSHAPLPGRNAPVKYYVGHCEGMAVKFEGPYLSGEQRDEKAKELKRQHGGSLGDIYWLNIDAQGIPATGAYK